MENKDKVIDINSRAYRFCAGKGVMNLPNKLTILRVLLIPVFVFLFYIEFTAHYFIALAVFAIASLTDLFDGKIARKYNLITNLGKFLDPIADKVLVLSALVVFLTRPVFFANWLGDWTLIAAGCGISLILARETIISGFRMVAAADNLVIAADIIGKYKTVAQMCSVIVLLVGVALMEFFPYYGQIIIYTGLVLFAVSIVLTVISGINYIAKNSAVLKK